MSTPNDTQLEPDRIARQMFVVTVLGLGVFLTFVALVTRMLPGDVDPNAPARPAVTLAARN